MSKILKYAVPAAFISSLPFLANAADSANLKSDDFVGISFWLISMALVASTAFFFMETQRVSAKWKTSLTVSGLVTFSCCCTLLLYERCMGRNWLKHLQFIDILTG
jgi:Na+-translocating ferredoxin:NAD+ oxidoreductase RnfD subunit